jgi:hypothetical protein
MDDDSSDEEGPDEALIAANFAAYYGDPDRDEVGRNLSQAVPDQAPIVISLSTNLRANQEAQSVDNASMRFNAPVTYDDHDTVVTIIRASLADRAWPGPQADKPPDLGEYPTIRRTSAYFTLNELQHQFLVECCELLFDSWAPGEAETLRQKIGHLVGPGKFHQYKYLCA